MFHTLAHRPANISELRFVDRAFERMLAGAVNQDSRSANAQNIRFTRRDNGLDLSVDLPGLTREQLSITIDGNLVRIESVQDAPRNVRLAYRLAYEVEVETSQAKLENGVLTLTLARLPEVQTAKTLNIA